MFFMRWKERRRFPGRDKDMQRLCGMGKLGDYAGLKKVLVGALDRRFLMRLERQVWPRLYSV